MERKPCVFASYRGQLEFLNCISRISAGSEFTASQRLGQAEVIAPVQVDVLVHQWGKMLDVRDGKTIDQTLDDLRENWPAIREQLLRGTYKPQPVRRVEIPKPGGGVRKLGIPTVLDRCSLRTAFASTGSESSHTCDYLRTVRMRGSCFA